MQLGQHVLELGDVRVKERCSFVEVTRRLLCCEVVHEQEAGHELRVLAHRLAKQLAQRAAENIATGIGELVDGSLGAPAFLLAFGGEDPAVAFEHVNRVIEGAEVEADELVLVALAHGRRHLVGVHRSLVEELQDRKRQWRGALHVQSSHIFYTEYMKSDIRCQVLRSERLNRRGWYPIEKVIAWRQGATARGRGADPM